MSAKRTGPGLFDAQAENHRRNLEPLAVRMRPRSIDEFVGQQQFLGPGKLLSRMLKADRLGSMIFYGPPGTGKTTLAVLVARQSDAFFETLNAAAASVADLRTALAAARSRVDTDGRQTVLFVDELHHFNKQQQNVLLPDVEAGHVVLVAATTSNPFFALIAPLLSRSRVFEFQPIGAEDIRRLLDRAIHDDVRGLPTEGHTIDEKALDYLSEVCDGDARRALSALEIAVLSLAPSEPLTVEIAQESVQKKTIRYDRDGDDHYDAASAMIKSLRGSDPDAALYWMARMLEGGEDPRFVARRLIISAAEDVGNADPQALVLAMSAAQATEFCGMPECRIPLAQAATYIATAPKSNAAYVAIDEALADVRQQRLLPVPMHLRDRHYGGAKRLGHGEGYQYAHNSDDGWVDQDYLGVDRTYYRPVDRGHEAELQRRLEDLRKRRAPTGDGEHEEQ